MEIDNKIKKIMTFKDNMERLTKIVNKIFKGDKGMLVKEEVSLIKLYNKSFSVCTKLENLTKEMEETDKQIKKWK